MRWYDDANVYANYLSSDTKYSLEQAAGLVAAISPRLHWERNTLYPQIIMGLHAIGDRDVANWPSMCVTHTCREKALKVLDGDLEPVMNGAKVENFYRSILLDKSSVAVDTWAARIALGNPNFRSGVPKSVYNFMAEAYALAGQEVGFTPSDTQAVSWCAYRLTSRLTNISSDDRVAA